MPAPKSKEQQKPYIGAPQKRRTRPIESSLTGPRLSGWAVKYNADVQYELKILDGKNEGGSIPLKASRYSIGSHVKDSIVLSDKEVKKRHLECIFIDDCLSILRAYGSKILVNGSIIDRLPIDIAPLDIVTIGKTSFAFGKKNATFPDKKHIRSVLKTGKSQRSKKRTRYKKPPATDWRQIATTVKNVSLAFIALTLFAAGLYGLTHFIFLKNKKAEINQARIILETALQTQPAFRFLYLEKKPLKHLEVKGYLADSQSATDLRQLLLPAKAESKIIFLPDIEDNLRNIAASTKIPQLALHYQLSPFENGRKLNVTISGIFSDEAQLAILKEHIQAENTFIDTVDFKVISNIVLKKRFASWKAKTPEFSKISLSFLPNGQLTLSGHMLRNFQSFWKKQFESFQNTLSVLPEFENNIQFAPFFYGRIKGLLIGKHSFIDLSFPSENRIRRAGIGSALPGGFAIHTIERNMLTLQYENNLYPFPINLLENAS